MRGLEAEQEAILEPHLPIVDAHHHLWDQPIPNTVLGTDDRHPLQAMLEARPLYLADELLADIRSGHNVRATVFIQSRRDFYRQDGPDMLRPVGETEYAARVAAGVRDAAQICAVIVGYADLSLGNAVAPVLEAHIAAGGGRFRGVRNSASWDADPSVIGPFAGAQGLYASDRFREGMAQLAQLGLTFDAWLLEPQLPELLDLARGFPEMSIILNHLGTPLGIGSYAGTQDQRFPIWRDNMRALAQCPNVTVKLGGLGMPFLGMGLFLPETPSSSSHLANVWGRYILTAIDLFGPERCMFESNYPAEAGCCSYAVLWNVFKRVAADFSASEKSMLFSGTARRIYNIPAEQSEEDSRQGQGGERVV